MRKNKENNLNQELASMEDEEIHTKINEIWLSDSVGRHKRCFFVIGEKPCASSDFLAMVGKTRRHFCRDVTVRKPTPNLWTDAWLAALAEAMAMGSTEAFLGTRDRP